MSIIHAMKCPYCGSTLIIERDGEYVCTNCGSVLGPVYVYDTYTEQAGYLYDEEIDLTPIWKSAEKLIRKSVNDKISFYRRLRAINERLRRTRETYSIYRAFECIEYVANALGIDREYVREAKEVFRKLASSKASGITYYQMAIAAMLYVILTRNIPVSVKAVINICRSRGHKISTESIRDALVMAGLKYSVRDRILSYVRLGLVKIFGDSWVTLYPKAEEFLNRLRKSFIQSKNPANVAALIVYCISKEQGHKLSIDEVANAMQVSPFTLRDYVNKLCSSENYRKKT